MVSCGFEECKKVVNAKSKAIKCKICSRCFHTNCALVSDDFYKLVKAGSAEWKCQKCPTQLNESIIYQEATDDDDAINPIHAEKETTHLDELKADLSSYNFSDCTMEKMAEYLKAVTTAILDVNKEIRSSQMFLSNKIDKIFEENKALKKENEHLNIKIFNIENHSKMLEEKINKMEMILDEPLQNERRNNIVIAGLPPKLTTTHFDDIFNKLGVQGTDITTITPLITKKEGKSESWLYVVKLGSEEKKMDIMLKKKSFGELFTEELNLEGKNNEIFFRHHLSPLQSKLYFEAKKIKTTNKMQYLWVKQNKIFLRKDSNSKIYSIINFNDICKINQIFNN